jgi:hypothetical protein
MGRLCITPFLTAALSLEWGEGFEYYSETDIGKGGKNEE